MKKKIYTYLSEKLKKTDILSAESAVTATEISEIFDIKRNTASKHLNDLLEDGKLIKINSRPVYFFEKNLLEIKLDKTAERNTFQSLDELMNNRESNIFETIIGRNESLKNPIEQLISAAVYPGGLPILLHGESGTGKSMLARMIYEYSINRGILPKNAPFVVFNCAQYYNNLELLSSHLFGYKKGAFTGADRDQSGLIESAEGGILFLDEVHRLSSEGQEKLFILMDKKVFSRIGETDITKHANLRLIFATSENIESNFLPTFLRRIPIISTLPKFSEKTYKEREELIYLMFGKESKVLNISLKVSSMVIKILAQSEYKGNIGEVENLIKQICAREFSNQQGNNPINIRKFSLPESFLDNHTRGMLKSSFVNDPILFTPNMDIRHSKECTIYNNFSSMFITKVFKCFTAHEEGDISFFEFKDRITKETIHFIDQLIFNDTNTSQEILTYVIRQVQETFQIVLHTKKFSANGNEIFMIANYLLKKNENVRYEISSNDLYRLYSYLYKKNKKNINLIFQMLENNLDISLNYFDKIFIILTQMINDEDTESAIGGLIVAHGYATASSISNVANRMLESHIFDSFDMPLDIRIEDLIEKIERYVNMNSYKEGILLLVDMGSLHHIGEKLDQTITSPIVLINNVSTEMALWGGELIKQGKSIIEISEKMKEAGKIACKIIYPKKELHRVIIISCSSGYGTAIKLKELFEKIIPKESELVFLAQDFDQLKREGLTSEIFKLNEVIAIMGTTNPDITNVPFISIEDLFTDRDNRLLQLLVKYTDEKIARVVNNEFIKNLSLNKIIDSLTILDSNKTILQIEPCIELLERYLNRKMNNNQKLSLYVHISCMIERLIRNQQMTTFPHDENFIENKDKIINIVKTAFNSIEMLYNINIPIEEVYYIYSITQNYM